MSQGEASSEFGHRGRLTDAGRSQQSEDAALLQQIQRVARDQPDQPAEHIAQTLVKVLSERLCIEQFAADFPAQANSLQLVLERHAAGLAAAPFLPADFGELVLEQSPQPGQFRLHTADYRVHAGSRRLHWLRRRRFRTGARSRRGSLPGPASQTALQLCGHDRIVVQSRQHLDAFGCRRGRYDHSVGAQVCPHLAHGGAHVGFQVLFQLHVRFLRAPVRRQKLPPGPQCL